MKNFILTLTEEEMVIVKNALFGDSDRYYEDLQNAGESHKEWLKKDHDERHRLMYKIIEQENLQKN